MIIFMADNGRPFPCSKTRLYDRGIRTPFIIKWPEKIRTGGNVCQGLISSIDIAPTLLEVAGAQTVPEFQGRSFAALLDSPANHFRRYVFAEHNWHDSEAYERMVRSSQYLYLLNERPELQNGALGKA